MSGPTFRRCVWSIKLIFKKRKPPQERGKQSLVRCPRATPKQEGQGRLYTA